MQLDPLKFCQTCGLQIYGGSSSWCHPPRLYIRHSFGGIDDVFLDGYSIAVWQKKPRVCWWNSRGERVGLGWPLKWTQICGEEVWMGKDATDVGVSVRPVHGQCAGEWIFTSFCAFLIWCPLNQKQKANRHTPQPFPLSRGSRVNVWALTEVLCTRCCWRRTQDVQSCSYS